MSLSTARTNRHLCVPHTRRQPGPPSSHAVNARRPTAFCRAAEAVQIRFAARAALLHTASPLQRSCSAVSGAPCLKTARRAASDMTCTAAHRTSGAWRSRVTALNFDGAPFDEGTGYERFFHVRVRVKTMVNNCYWLEMLHMSIDLNICEGMSGTD